MRKKLVVKGIFMGAGALCGFLYYRFIGCAAGACPITSNPVASTLYGAALGFLVSVIAEKPE